MKQVLTTVLSSNEVMPGVFLVWAESPQIAATARPGQFVMVDCGENTLLRRPFSIHQVNDDKTRFAILFSVFGKGTQWLSRCKAGDKIDLLGPLGNGFTLTPMGGNVLLIAGGIGIAPLCFLAREALNNNCYIKMLAGTKAWEQLDIENRLPREIDLVAISETSLMGNRGMGNVTILLPDYANWDGYVFACGPSQMYRTMARMPELKDKPVQVSLEVRMGCGFGLCYGCTIKTKTGLKQICKDGPVFELDEILWDEFVDI